MEDNCKKADGEWARHRWDRRGNTKRCLDCKEMRSRVGVQDRSKTEAVRTLARQLQTADINKPGWTNMPTWGYYRDRAEKILSKQNVTT